MLTFSPLLDIQQLHLVIDLDSNLTFILNQWGRQGGNSGECGYTKNIFHAVSFCSGLGFLCLTIPCTFYLTKTFYFEIRNA